LGRDDGIYGIERSKIKNGIQKMFTLGSKMSETKNTAGAVFLLRLPSALGFLS
jgi:hypothetical protein